MTKNKIQIKKQNTNLVSRKTFEEVIAQLTLNSDTDIKKENFEVKFQELENAITKKDKEDKFNQVNNLVKENANLFLYLEKNQLLQESVYWNKDLSFSDVATDLADQFKDEYGCKSPSDITLCQIVANAYVRVMRLSKLMFGYMGIPQEITDLKNQYYNNISKELDRAERQYYTGLNTLKSLGRPKFQVNIKTNNAFIAQNQLLNNNHENNHGD